MMYRNSTTRGFTLIELMVVISIIGFLSTIVLNSLHSARMKANDSKRLTELREMQTALELYYADNGKYPDGDGAGAGGWDTPGNMTFIAELATKGYMQNLRDPGVNDEWGNYRYYRFAAGSWGCPRAYYVLGVVDLESSPGQHPRSPGWACPGRNWNSEMEWHTGKFEN